MEHREFSILHDALQMNCGLHTLTVVIKVDKRELFWDHVKKRAKRKETFDGRLVFTYDPVYMRRFIAKHLRLMYSETENMKGYMIVAFEPGDLFGEMEGGILPFHLWKPAWPEIIANIEEATDAPDLFERWHRLSRIELATDV